MPSLKVKKKPSQAIKELEKLADSLKGSDTVKVGLPKGSNDYPDGTSVIMVGAVQEFGSPSRGVPERSYLRSTLIVGKRSYKSLFKKLAKKIAKGEITKKQAMETLGMQLQGDVQQRITEGIEPPLKHREGTPLIDTGHLRQSITYVVDDDAD